MPQFRPLLLALCAMPLWALGCGYHFQEAHNPLLDLGIHRIYVESFRNLTYRPGIEHYFTTAMVREIGRSKSFELVNSAEAADAVLRGSVVSADEAITGQSGLILGTKTLTIASEYTATVSCLVTLVDRRGRQIFSQTLSDNKAHPGSAQLGDTGSTAPLTNDSEQRLAVQFMAGKMMASMYQRMVDTF